MCHWAMFHDNAVLCFPCIILGCRNKLASFLLFFVMHPVFGEVPSDTAL